jgi:hypothetical protein
MFYNTGYKFSKFISKIISGISMSIISNGTANISFYLEISGGQNSNPYLNAVHFLTPVLIRHLWQLKAVVSPNGCLIRACSILEKHLFYFSLTQARIIFILFQLVLNNVFLASLSLYLKLK